MVRAVSFPPPDHALTYGNGWLSEGKRDTPSFGLRPTRPRLGGMRSGQIASVGTKAHGLAYVGRRAQNPRPIGLRPYKIVRARLKNGVAGLVAGPGPHDTTTSEARMAQTDQSDLARRLVKLLREYGLPATTTAFSVHVALDDIVRVDCKFLAVGDPRPTN